MTSVHSETAGSSTAAAHMAFSVDVGGMPSVKVDDRGCEDLCIAFSSRATAAGKFTFFKTLSNLNANIIYANDYSNGWFLDGTPDFQNEAFFMSWLREAIDRYKGRNGKLFMLGASMGAYASLKYGSIYGADRIFVMGPESELCLPLGRSVTSVTNVAVGSGQIAGLAYRNPADVMVISGSNDIVDVYCASSLKAGNPGLDVRLIRNRTHVVAKYLDANFDLPSIITAFFTTGDRSFLDSAETTEVPSLEQGFAMRMFNEQLAARKVDTSRAELIIGLADLYPLWSMPQHFAALIFETQGDLATAERYLRRALKAQKNLGRSRLKLGQMFAQQQRWKECIDLLEEPSSTAYTENIARLLSSAYEQIGDSAMAEDAIKRLSV